MIKSPYNKLFCATDSVQDDVIKQSSVFESEMDDIDNTSISSTGSTKEQIYNTVEQNQRICIIIEKFCDSLVLFATYVIQPALNSTDIIKKKKLRTPAFDSYVDGIAVFNIIINNIGGLIKDIIISLNLVFIRKTVHTLLNFMDKLEKFLNYLVKEHVFDDLYKLDEILQNKYTKDIEMINRLHNIKYLIFHMCNLSVDVTALFIPPLSVIKNGIIMLDDKIEAKIESRKKDVEINTIRLNCIIKQLLTIELRAEIIRSLENNELFQCLKDKNAKELIRIIENLQTEYIELLHIMFSLKLEIRNYKERKISIFSRIMQKLVK